MEPRTAHFVWFLRTIDSVTQGPEAGDAILAALAVYFPSVAADPAAVLAAGSGSIETRVIALNALVMAKVPPEGDPARE
jgi:hypothetical protein